MPESFQVCCVCLNKCQSVQNINENLHGDAKYIEKLQVCVPNEIWHDDFNICNGCVDKLNTAYTFIQLCVKSEKYRKGQLQVIKQSKEPTPTRFICQECNKSFRLKRTLSSHITRIHRKHRYNLKKESEICDPVVIDPVKRESFLNEIDKDGKKDIVNEHQYSDNIKFDVENDIKEDFNDCNNSDLENRNSSYSSDEELKKKKKIYKGKKRGPKYKGPKKCDFCELLFARSDRYVQHLRSKHTFEKPFQCDLCDSKYFSSYNLNVHKRKHTNEKPFVCAACGKKFRSSTDLWQHNKIHDRVRQYPCTECDRSFKTHSNLRTHKLQMHQDPLLWKHVCPVCGKKFPLNNNLVKHMRRHEGIKPFACHLCEKRFVEKIDMQTHLLSHSDERLFQCHLCTKEYKKKETLRRHLKAEHDTGNYRIKQPEKKICCPMCPKVFAFNNKLQRHILTHTGEKPVKCEFCEKRFRDNYDRNVHLRKGHNMEPQF
ncbi:zinc finger protein 664-like [Sitophilus oryzae]|uniref:Zinc finger protein 664-like n=1 Tax=Sitophilus oryzae TaxID=7048 RepID=A0A6J2XU69_SITOR|nr:zinc finger protein 664-like [Sitophilus oryzae]